MCSLIFLFCSLINVNAIIKIPLQRRELVQNTSSANHLLKTFPIFHPLTRNGMLKYYMDIKIGTHPQTFTVCPDTGSDVLWVPGVECTDKKHGCFTHRKFDPRNSISYKSSIEVYNQIYLCGFVSGQYAYDVINIAGLHVKEQKFALVSEDSGMPFSEVIEDGMWGLSSNNKTVSIIRNMYEQKLIDKQVFSYYLNSNPSAPKQGFLLLGGSDPNLYENHMFYIPVDVGNNDLWQAQLDSTKVGLHELRADTTVVYFDTGSTDIVIDRESRIKLKKILGIPYHRNIIPCSRRWYLPRIHFIFGGKMIILDAMDYVLEIAGECVFRIDEMVGNHSNKEWLFGTPFFRKYYVEFDFEQHRMGFGVSHPIP